MPWFKELMSANRLRRAVFYQNNQLSSVLLRYNNKAVSVVEATLDATLLTGNHTKGSCRQVTTITCVPLQSVMIKELTLDGQPSPQAILRYLEHYTQKLFDRTVQSVFDYQRLRTSSEQQTHLRVVSAAQQVVDATLAPLQAWRLTIDVVDVDALGLLRLLPLLRPQHNASPHDAQAIICYRAPQLLFCTLSQHGAAYCKSQVCADTDTLAVQQESKQMVEFFLNTHPQLALKQVATLGLGQQPFYHSLPHRKQSPLCFSPLQLDPERIGYHNSSLQKLVEQQANLLLPLVGLALDPAANY